MKNFLIDSFAKIGYIWGIIGTATTILVVPGSVTIGIKWMIIIGFIIVAAVMISILASIKYNNILKNGTRFTITAYSNEGGNDCYYTDYSSNLRIGTLVCVYYSKPRSKRLGYGIVQNSSSDEYVEIKMMSIHDELKDIFENSKTNYNKVLQDMYIIPNVYVENISDIYTCLEGGNTSNG